ncbi:unnamed protein product, partial [Sphagnum troendelagicum]
MTTPALYVTCYPVTANANVFACASASCNLIGTIPTGTDVFIQCVTTGQLVNFVSQWDYVGLSSTGVLVGGYVSDQYVYCGATGLCPGP